MKQAPDIFARLRNGETVPFDDPEYHKLRDVSFATRKLLLQLNQSTDPEEMRALLSRITGTEIDESSAIFPPFHVNYGKHTKIGKNVFINFDCVFLDFGGITIEDGVFIAPKVSLLTEGHPHFAGKQALADRGADSYQKERVDRCQCHHHARRDHRGKRRRGGWRGRHQRRSRSYSRGRNPCEDHQNPIMKP